MLQNPFKITYGGWEFINLHLIPFALRYEILMREMMKPEEPKPYLKGTPHADIRIPRGQP